MYERGFLRGKYNKFGKLYDNNGELIYEGEFLEGNYHGDGILLIKENNYMNEFYEGIGSPNEGKLYIKVNLIKVLLKMKMLQ